MFEDIPGRLLSGAIWGLGAGLVLNVLNKRTAPANSDGQGQQSARPIAKTLMKAYVAAEQKVRDATSEARESLSDIYSEVQAERRESESTQHARPVNIDLDSEEPDEQPTTASGHARRSHRSSADNEA